MKRKSMKSSYGIPRGQASHLTVKSVEVRTETSEVIFERDVNGDIIPHKYRLVPVTLIDKKPVPE